MFAQNEDKEMSYEEHLFIGNILNVPQFRQERLKEISRKAPPSPWELCLENELSEINMKMSMILEEMQIIRAKVEMILAEKNLPEEAYKESTELVFKTTEAVLKEEESEGTS